MPMDDPHMEATELVELFREISKFGWHVSAAKRGDTWELAATCEGRQTIATADPVLLHAAYRLVEACGVDMD